MNFVYLKILFVIVFVGVNVFYFGDIVYDIVVVVSDILNGCMLGLLIIEDLVGYFVKRC